MGGKPGEALHDFTIYFLETNEVIPLGTAPQKELISRMRQLAQEFEGAGWTIVTDLSGTMTGYPMMCLETSTGAEVQLMVVPEAWL